MLANILKWFFLISPFIYFDIVFDASGTPRVLYLSLFLLISYFIVLINKIELKVPIFFFYIYLSYLCSIIINSLYINSYIEIIEIVKRSEYFLFFILVYNIGWIDNKNRAVKGIITFLVIILFMGSLELLYIILNNDVDISNSFYTVSSSFSHKNIYSYVVLISLPFLAVWKTNRNIKTALFSWALIILLTLQTRSVLLAIIFAIFYLLINKRHLLRKKLVSILLISISILLVSFYIQNQIGTFNLFVDIFDFNNTSSERYATIYERFFLWGNSLQMFNENWLLGVGIGNWPIYFPSYGLTLWRLRQGTIIMQRPHNDVIENFNELGIIGGLFFIFILIYPLFKSSKIKHLNVINCGLICFFIVSLFSFPQERVIPSLLFFTLVAFKLQNSLCLTIHKYFLYLILGLTIPFTCLSYSNLKNEVSFKKFMTHRESLDYANAINLLLESKTTFSKLDKTSTPIDWYIGEVYLQNKDVNSAIKHFIQALEIHPYHIHILNSLGRCYLLKNNHEMSIYYFKRSIQIAPFFEKAIYNLAYNYSIISNYNQAVIELKNIEDKTTEKFIDRCLMYGKRIIKEILNEREFNELEKFNLINMMSNDNWILSLITKSHKAEISLERQILVDLDYLNKLNIENL